MNPISANPDPDSTKRAVQSLPGVDLHRHLEGSLRLATLHEIAAEERLDLGRDELDRQVRLTANGERSPERLFNAFAVIRRFFRSAEIIRRVTAEAVQDAAAEGLRYLELRFTPAALAQQGGYTIEEVVDWVTGAARDAALGGEMRVSLIVSINRHEPLELAERAAQAAADHLEAGVVGVDLAGDEALCPLAPFQPLLLNVREAGLGLTIHAGEWTDAESVRQAIEALQPERIGHGIRVMDDRDVMTLALERGTVFEIGLTSNWLTGAVPSLEEHPLLAMVQGGLRVTLNTDDPAIFGTDLRQEYLLAVERLGFSLETLKGLTLTAAQASFLPRSERTALERELVETLWGGGG